MAEIIRPGLKDILNGRSLSMPDGTGGTDLVRVNTLRPSLLAPRKRTIVIIGDYNDHDAPERVGQAIDREVPSRKERRRGHAHVDSFSTIETAYQTAVLALHTEYPDETIIFQNTAPRGAEKERDTTLDNIVWTGNNKQKFVMAALDTGVPILGVNAGYNLSLVKDHVVGLWEVDVPHDETQFRSLYSFPKGLRILRGRRGREFIGRRLDPEIAIAEPPYAFVDEEGGLRAHVLYVDGRNSPNGYHNIKLLLNQDELPLETLVSKNVVVTFEGRDHKVKNILDGGKVENGELFLTTGSSGPRDNRWLEVNQMYGHAADELGLNRVTDNTTISIRPASS